LMMNPAKTDVLWCSTRQQLTNLPLTPAGTTVQPSTSVRNLGVLFDADLSLKAHVNQLTARCYCCMSTSHQELSTYSLIVTRLDYCNSLLTGYNNKQFIDTPTRVELCSASYIWKKLSRPRNSAAS